MHLKAGDRELVEGGGAFLAGGSVQIKRPVQGRLGRPLVGGLLHRPVGDLEVDMKAFF